MPSCPCFPLTTHPETSKLICCYRCSCAQEMFWCQLPQPDACQLLHENCRHSWIWDLLFLGIHIHCITACKPQQVKPPSPPKQLPDSPLSSLFLFFFSRFYSVCYAFVLWILSSLSSPITNSHKGRQSRSSGRWEASSSCPWQPKLFVNNSQN